MVKTLATSRIGGAPLRAVRPSAAAPRLPHAELVARALALRLVLTDSDGVLTDGGVYYSDSGEALRRFSVRDGMGVERLREAGIATAIITRERSGCVERRAAKLRLPHLFLGVWDKAAHLPAVLAETGLGPAALAYIGDDVNDLAILTAIGEHGLTAAPADAMPELLAACHYRCAARGGYGAFRDFAEWILGLRRDAAARAAAGKEEEP
ncbi:MAG TPA: 3-deoxy-D-manno-octulosonate 8-phosphate phosphatase [Thermoanaerobaculia bacterium]|nr:3-deoxy-D-manno-octulosonate 8-phosphate phosphatase [Thermoanaerobaculia bacterium]